MSSKRIVLAPGLYTGHLFEHLAVGQELLRRGHTVYVATEPAAREHVKQAGCHFVPMPMDPFRRSFVQSRSTAQVARVLSNMAKAVSVSLLEFLRSQPFDAVVTESLHLGAGLAAERSGIPWISLALIPSESGRVLKRGAQAFIPTKTLRKKLGLPATNASSFDQGISPLLHVLPWTPEFDLGPVPPQSVHVGPLNYEPPAGTTPAWVRKLDRRVPTVLITMTSSPFEILNEMVDEYFRISVAVLKQMKVQGIITLSGAQGSVQPGLSGNVRLVRFVAHSALMPYVDATVAHGGWGIVSRCLTTGVPPVVVPFGLDQGLNGQMVQKMGVGRHLPLERLNEKSLRAQLDSMLAPGAPERKAAQELGRRLRKWKSQKLAADLVLKFARGARPRT